MKPKTDVQTETSLRDTDDDVRQNREAIEALMTRVDSLDEFRKLMGSVLESLAQVYADFERRIQVLEGRPRGGVSSLTDLATRMSVLEAHTSAIGKAVVDAE